MRDGLVVGWILRGAGEFSVLGLLEALQLTLQRDDLLLETAEQVALLIHFNIKNYKIANASLLRDIACCSYAAPRPNHSPLPAPLLLLPNYSI